ncbi:NPH3 domain [Dillenia turbinata]|uniref:NPH3 domain n=1 Tax=Dillenia turbinata TaxID=194707 RepID=A0AAN8VJH7_9MAGN
MPGEPETFELVARFCHCLELNLSTENIIPLSCLAVYLGMTETQSENNLLKKASTFFYTQVLRSWYETTMALQIDDSLVLYHAAKIGLLGECFEAIISKVLDDLCLLGESLKILNYRPRPNTRRRLFVDEEHLINLPLQIYEPLVRKMILRRVPLEYVAASVCRFVEKWAFIHAEDEHKVSYSKRQVIEAVERLLPAEKGVVPCTLLFEMLRCSISLEADIKCRSGLEFRIGKQVDRATHDDLLILFRGYAKDAQHDVECVRRILKHFYTNFTSSNVSGLNRVAELIEGFLAQVAKKLCGVYRAIGIFLDTHRHLIENEREYVCLVLECQKLSAEAREHAAQNQQLPLRVVVQVLLASQLQLRDAVARELQKGDAWLRKPKEEDEEEGNQIKVGFGEEDLEKKKMGAQIVQFERQCQEMRKSENDCCRWKKKVGVWSEMKRKFGCVGSRKDNCNSQVKKKVHPYMKI